MIYLQKHNKKNVFNSKYTKILLVIIFVLFLSVFDTTRLVAGNIFSYFLKPGNIFYEKLYSIPNYFSEKNRIIEENNKLNNDIQSYISDRYAIEVLKSENKYLKEVLDLKPVDSTVSMIISRFPQISSDTLIIDKGLNDSVSQGDVVLVHDRIYVGTVQELFNRRALVSMTSFPGNTSFGRVSRTEEVVELVGTGGGTMKSTVPISLDIKEGDLILTNLPYTYAMAVVKVVEENLSAGSKSVLLSVPIDFHNLNTVFVNKTQVE